MERKEVTRQTTATGVQKETVGARAARRATASLAAPQLLPAGQLLPGSRAPVPAACSCSSAGLAPTSTASPLTQCASPPLALAPRSVQFGHGTTAQVQAAAPALALQLPGRQAAPRKPCSSRSLPACLARPTRRLPPAVRAPCRARLGRRAVRSPRTAAPASWPILP